MYLNACTGRLKLERRDYLKRLHTLSQMQEDSFILLWILLQEDSEAYRTPSKKLYELETQYEIGCRSPFLYLEAFRLIKENVLLFEKSTDFIFRYYSSQRNTACSQRKSLAERHTSQDT